MGERDDYWFPAKRYGWGWGPPKKWQGWLVLIGYIVSVMLVSVYVPANENPIFYPILMVFFTCVLIAFCLKKGEPPAWRWGRK